MSVAHAVINDATLLDIYNFNDHCYCDVFTFPSKSRLFEGIRVKDGVSPKLTVGRTLFQDLDGFWWLYTERKGLGEVGWEHIVKDDNGDFYLYRNHNEKWVQL